MLPVLLKPVEKCALDLISDWPWIALKDLAGLLDVSPQRASKIVIPLEGFGLAARPRRRRRTPGPYRPGAGPTGPRGPHLRRRGEAAAEHCP